MTQKDMLSQTQSLVKDSQTAAELQATLKLIEANNLSAGETKKLVMDMMAKSQSRGANWSGDILWSCLYFNFIFLVKALNR